MRGLFLATAAVGVMVSAGLLPELAQARDYPFCIKGRDYGTPLGDCSFDTYEQCKATASGREDFCDSNPYFAQAREPRMVYPPRRHHHRY